MREVVYYVACSLDGFIATPDGGLDWLAPFESSGEDYGYNAFYESVDSILVGSHTFEQSLTFADWPYPGKPVWVFSGRTFAAEREDLVVTAETPTAVAANVEGRGLKRAWLVGGGALAGSFLEAGLITELIISVMPVVLGAGVHLFGARQVRRRLNLLETTRYPDGVCQLRYLVA